MKNIMKYPETILMYVKAQLHGLAAETTRQWKEADQEEFFKLSGQVSGLHQAIDLIDNILSEYEKGE